MPKKYEVLFVPSFSKISTTRSTARHNGEDEFDLKTAKEVKKMLIKRGDKAVQIREVKD